MPNKNPPILTLLRATMLTAMFAAMASTTARAAEMPRDPSGDCIKTSLVHFVSGGREIPSHAIGKNNSCDDFGGNLVYTPRHHIFLFVNFNIPGTIDLDRVDSAYELALSSTRGNGEWLQSIELSVVDQQWLRNKAGDDRDAVLGMGNRSLFISERAVEQNRFDEMMRSFYATAASR